MTDNLSRRDWLRTALGGAAGLGLVSSLPAADDKKDGGFKLSVQSYTFRKFPLDKTIQKLSDMKVPYVELTQTHLPLNASPEKVAACLKLCKDMNVAPISYGVQGFDKNHDGNKKTFEFAKSLGLKYISANPTADAFDSLDKLCDEYKIAIAIHPHGPVGKISEKKKALWTTAEQIMKAIKNHNELIGTCLDTGHLLRMELIGEPVDIVEQIKIMGKRNYGFHVKDHDLKKDVDVVFGSPEGKLKIAEILKTLKDVKFDGYMSIEYEANADEPTKDVDACVKYLRDSISKMS